jgi:hypothetical protein
MLTTSFMISNRRAVQQALYPQKVGALAGCSVVFGCQVQNRSICTVGWMVARGRDDRSSTHWLHRAEFALSGYLGRESSRDRARSSPVFAGKPSRS